MDEQVGNESLNRGLREEAWFVVRNAMMPSVLVEVGYATNPQEAAAGTIRADFAETVDENAVHGSDGPDTAAAEIAFFFPEGVCERTR